jgi:hypothetical protein
VSKTISKIGGTCRNIQGPEGVVFGEFFLVFCRFLSGRGPDTRLARCKLVN